MKYLTYSIVFLILILVSGCATTGDVGVTTPQIPVKAVEDKLIERNPNPDKCPEWVYTIPEDKEGYKFFVAMSPKVVSEQNARDEALNSAINQVVAYIGSDVKIKLEKMITSYGLSSSVIDPTVVARQAEEHSRKALARKVEAREWCIEKWFNIEKGEYYIARVLSRAPGSEIEKIIAEQEQRAKELAETVKKLNQQLAKARKFLADGDNTSKTKIMEAYYNYKEAIEIAEKVKVDVSPYPELSAKIVTESEAVINQSKEGQKSMFSDPDTWLPLALIDLTTEYKNKPVIVAVAKVCYEDTDSSSEFGEYLTKKINEIISNNAEYYTLISRDLFQKQLQEKKLSLDDCLVGKNGGSPIISKLQGLIFVHYYLNKNVVAEAKLSQSFPGDLLPKLLETERQKKGDEDYVELKVELQEIGTGKTKSHLIELPKSMFPAGIKYVPENIDIVNQATDFFKNYVSAKEFKIGVWPDKGEGSVYKQGETVKFHFKTNKNCYVYLYHMDTSGEVRMLFPNKFHSKNYVEADKTYSIPDDTMNFDFQIDPPFGTEMLKAVASLQPISELVAANVSLKNNQESFRSIGKIGGDEVVSLTRSINTVPKNERSENICSITTLPK